VPDYVLSAAAADDLRDIWAYIATGHLDAADRVLASLQSAMVDLSAMPGMGHLRTDLAREPLRFWQVFSYLIAYRPDASPLQIVRVLSVHRDVAGILADGSSPPGALELSP